MSGFGSSGMANRARATAPANAPDGSHLTRSVNTCPPPSMSRQVVERFTAHYVFALGLSRFLSCAHWILQVGACVLAPRPWGCVSSRLLGCRAPCPCMHWILQTGADLAILEIAFGLSA